MNGTPYITTVTQGIDESANEEIGEFVGAVEEGVCGGEEGVRKQEIGDDGVTGEGVEIVVGVGLRIGGPVEEEKSVIWVVF